MERKCRCCGCTETNACIDDDGYPCFWVAEDLCSACDDELRMKAEQEAIDDEPLYAALNGPTIGWEDWMDESEVL